MEGKKGHRGERRRGETGKKERERERERERLAYP